MCDATNRNFEKTVGVDVRITPRVENGELVVDMNAQLDERGGLPSELAFLRDFLNIFNAGDALITDAYKDAIQEVLDAVAQANRTLIRQAVVTEGLGAFDAQLTAPSFFLSEDRLRLRLGLSALVPGAAVCALVDKAQKANGVVPGR